MLKNRGTPIRLDQDAMTEWTEAMDALRQCGSKPYLVINSSVVTLIDDYVEHQKYRAMLERMIVCAEKYAFVDHGPRFWTEQFRLIDEKNPSEIAS